MESALDHLKMFGFYMLCKYMCLLLSMYMLSN